MTRVKVTRFWLDSAGGTLTEISDQINSESLAEAVDILEDTALNETSRSILSGNTSFTLSLNGWYDTTSANSVADIIQPALGTSVTKTFQAQRGTHYYNGECLPAAWESSGAQGRNLVTWSATLEGDATINKTSVALS